MSETTVPGHPVELAVLHIMHLWRREGALYTSDIASGVKAPTTIVRMALKKLEKQQRVRRVVTGNPTSWELVNDEH